MTFEARLQSIDETLKALLVAFQTGAAAQHTFGAPDATTAAVKTARVDRKAKETSTPAVDTTLDLPGVPSKDTTLDLPGVPSKDTDLLGLVDGHPSGTRYWVIEAHNTVYAQLPGEPDPLVQGAVITSAKDYGEKKAEYAKTSLVPPVTATPQGAALASVASAPTASPAASTPSFDEVTKVLKELGSDKREGLGRTALVALVNKYLPADATVRNVPALAALGKNAEIYAEAMALLNPVAVEEADIFA